MNADNHKIDCSIIIPAVKKNVAFSDDLVKKIDGKFLIQRVLDKAKELVDSSRILVVTDSEEISLICERNGICFDYDKNLRLKDVPFMTHLAEFFAGYLLKEKYILVLWPYAPLVSVEDIVQAFEIFRKVNSGVSSVKGSRHEFVLEPKGGLNPVNHKQKFFVEVKAFFIFNAHQVRECKNIKWFPYELKNNRLEIKDYHDWWVCERLLQRKRIVFRVIGNNKVGMGHVYRALALAHENSRDEILFVCDTESLVAVQKIAGHDYPLEVLPSNRIVDRLIELKPDLVINDVLNTSKNYVRQLKQKGIKVVNFEDLGTGANEADLVFNELYDEPLTEKENSRWGYEYCFLRDEFLEAQRHSWSKTINNVLVTFGGTDPSNLTLITLKAICEFCHQKQIKIHVVVGPGYLHTKKLLNFIKTQPVGLISFTNQTGVMSRIMEKTPLAISSNGRTVYELAHMRIPSIIISHHDREQTHKFASSDNGFISLGVYQNNTEKLVLNHLKELYGNCRLRKQLWECMKNFNFLPNKKRVVREIERCLDGE